MNIALPGAAYGGQENIMVRKTECRVAKSVDQKIEIYGLISVN